MRRRRFVRLLGSAVEDAGRDVGALASERRARYENGDLAPGGESAAEAERVTRELPRRLARHVDGAAGGGVAFSARVASPELPAEGPDLGVLLCVDLPEYAVTAGVVAEVRSLASRSATDRYDAAGLAETAEGMLATTADAFVLALPVGGTVRVVPAAAVAGIAGAGDPVPETFPDAVYSRSVGRFFEEFAECFVGDRALADAVDGADDRDGIAAFQRETGVRDVLVLEVSATAEPTDAKLTDFGQE
jgi:hypothetical protein